jgi:hypothetical protein
LYYQERERERRGGNVEDYYFIPAPADRPVRALRQWVRKYAHIPGPLPTYFHRNELFDRWSQHTDHCRHCSHAAKVMVPKWRKNTYRALCISVLLAKFLVARLVVVGCSSRRSNREATTITRIIERLTRRHAPFDQR